MTSPERDDGSVEHGNIFGRGWGSMFIHVQRESGLAHRTLVLRPWQVQALRLVVSKWFAVVLTATLLSWGYFFVQTARVPFLTKRIAHLEQDAAKLDTLQATLEQVQRRYDQVQQMLSASSKSAPAAGAQPATPPDKPAEKNATKAPTSTPEKTPAKAPDKTQSKTQSKTP